MVQKFKGYAKTRIHDSKYHKLFSLAFTDGAAQKPVQKNIKYSSLTGQGLQYSTSLSTPLTQIQENSETVIFSAPWCHEFDDSTQFQDLLDYPSTEERHLIYLFKKYLLDSILLLK